MAMQKRFIILTYQRHGSNYLSELLACHHEVSVARELLNPDVFPEIAQMSKDELLDHVDRMLSQDRGRFQGIKVFPDHLEDAGISLPELSQHIDASYLIALWRSSAIDTHVSTVVVKSTGQWYTETQPTHPEPIRVEVGDVAGYCEVYEAKMGSICAEWPLQLPTIFVNYECLFENTPGEMERIFRALSLETYSPSYNVNIRRQNPFPLEKKISNFYELDSEDLKMRLDLEKLVRTALRQRLGATADTAHIIPEPEPAQPVNGWTYRVAEPYFSERCRNNVIQALDSRSISSAAMWTKKLNQALKNAFQSLVAQCCSNGFSALVLALQCCGIGQGDEVIVPSLTMVAVSNAVVFLGATPVFVDCDVESYNPEVNQIADGATASTRCVIVTHTYGVPCRTLSEIARLCGEKGWFLIEDISECVGVEAYNDSGGKQLLGTFGHFGCASLYANKIIHGGDGGFVVAKDRQMRAKLASLVNHGFTPAFHFVHFQCAFNAKMNGLGAAFATGCVGEMKEIMHHRSCMAQQYRRHLQDLPLELMPQAGCGDTPWVFSILCGDARTRNNLRSHLATKGIETRNFFFPLHMEPCNQQFHTGKNLPNAERLSSLGMYLPTHSNLTEADVSYISAQVRSYFSEAETVPRESPMEPPIREACFGVNIDLSGGIDTEVYDANGNSSESFDKKQLVKDIVSFGIEAASALKDENWDTCTELVLSYEELRSRAEELGLGKALNKVALFCDYLKTLAPYERFGEALWQRRPDDETTWKHIPSTTDPELVKCVLWAIETYNVKIIVEFGAWFGHMTVAMAETAVRHHDDAKVIAVDSWQWQRWMNEFCYLADCTPLQSVFAKNTEHIAKHVVPVEVDIVQNTLPVSITGTTPDLVFFDFTDTASELETVWNQVVSAFTPNKTIIVVNTISLANLPFLTKHALELRPLAKPRTNAKVFRFVGLEKPVQCDGSKIDNQISRRSIDFSQPVTWTHHHLTPFKTAIDWLAAEVGIPRGRWLFLPSVEEYLCDHPVPVDKKPWIGIVHSLPHTDLFYVPDMHRLCTSWRYADWLRLCRGLVVLTKVQEKYLKEHLPSEYRFPILRVKLPSIGCETFRSDQTVQPPEVQEGATKLVHIGAYARDLDFFQRCQVPPNFKKVLLVGDDDMRDMVADRKFADIEIWGRIAGEEYELLLRQNVPILCLKHDGAANVLLGECIVRNVPILAPRLEAVVEYIGEDYPLLYDTANEDLCSLLTPDRIESAATYLKIMDKSDLTIGHFCETLKRNSIIQAAPLDTTVPPEEYCPPSSQLGTSYDVAISIACFRRTHHLKDILDALWNNQTFSGSMQIILWNNNQNRPKTVKDIAKKYMVFNSEKKFIEVIDSTFNHYCAVRFALPQLVRSERVLICDDDIIPGNNFVSFFLENHKKHPEDVLCVRGHYFLPHTLNVEDPAQQWKEYDFIRFADDKDPERLIHYVHADACLLPVECLRECSSVALPDNDFRLVDDYWMSYVASHKFGRNLRKLHVSSANTSVLSRTGDSDSEEIALHKNPVTTAAQLRMYIYHMSDGWPKWSAEGGEERRDMHSFVEATEPFCDPKIKSAKLGKWDDGFTGFNISSHVTEVDIEALVAMGVQVVRIGSAGCQEDIDPELSALTTYPQKELERLSAQIGKLGKAGISVVLTLEKISTPELWRILAKELASYKNVIGYDVINEPFTEEEAQLHWAELGEKGRTEGHKKIENEYVAITEAVREVDQVTPIIVESTFWAHYSTLKFLDVKRLQSVAGENLILSIHYYEPRLLTHRAQNKGRFSFPGTLPIYDVENPFEDHEVDERFVKNTISEAVTVANTYGLRLFMAEAGINRCVLGADRYLKSILSECAQNNISVCLYGFRDMFCDFYDYELGADPAVGSRFQSEAQKNNNLMKTIINAIDLRHSKPKALMENEPEFNGKRYIPFCRRDMIYDEREADRKLRDELKKRRDNGEKNLKIYRDRIVQKEN